MGQENLNEENIKKKRKNDYMFDTDMNSFLLQVTGMIRRYIDNKRYTNVNKRYEYNQSHNRLDVNNTNETIGTRSIKVDAETE